MNEETRLRRTIDCVNVRPALFLPSIRVLLFGFSPSNAKDIAFNGVGVEGDAPDHLVTHLRCRKPLERRRCACRQRRQYPPRRLDPPAPFQRTERQEAEGKAA